MKSFRALMGSEAKGSGKPPRDRDSDDERSSENGDEPDSRRSSVAGSVSASAPVGTGAAGAASMDDTRSKSSFADALSERLDIQTQMTGVLWKKDTAGSSSWKERYFVLKDGYLLYYTEPKSNMMVFDMHPKGVVPLEDVEVETVRAGPTKALQSSIRISHRCFGTKSVLLCAKDDAERDKWIAAINASRQITFPRHLDNTATIETLKKQLADASTRLASSSGSTFKATEQLTRLSLTNRALMTALQRAEAKYGIRIDVDYADAGMDVDAASVDSTSSRGLGSMALPSSFSPPVKSVLVTAEPAAFAGAAPLSPASRPLNATEAATDLTSTLPPPPSVPAHDGPTMDGTHALPPGAVLPPPPPTPMNGSDATHPSSSGLPPPPSSAPLPSVPAGSVLPPPPPPPSSDDARPKKPRAPAELLAGGR